MSTPATKRLKEVGMEMIDRALQGLKRVDGWVNYVTGAGTSRDKLAAGFFDFQSMLDVVTLEALYDDDLAARMVDQLPEDAMRGGFRVALSTDDEDDAGDTLEDEQAILTAFDDLTGNDKFTDAWCFGRLFGAAGLFLLTDDGTAVDKPLIPESLRKIIALVPVDRRDLVPRAWDQDPRSPTFGEPVLYDVMRAPGLATSVQIMPVHASRLIMFSGIRTSRRRRNENAGWHLSVLQRPHEVLRQFGSSWQSVSMRMQDWSQGVFKMKDLIQMVATKGPSVVKDRMEIIDISRSVARSVLIDSDGEEFTTNETNFAGVSDVMEKLMLRLAAAANMPVTLLFGQSPAGLNATGESDQRHWDDVVRSAQRQVAMPKLRHLIGLLMASKEGPTGGKILDNWTIKFPPLKQMTDLEEATLRKTVADADHIYITDGVVRPEEVAMSRFRADGWSAETVIDLELRSELEEIDREHALEAAKNPEPNPEDPNADKPTPGTAG